MNCTTLYENYKRCTKALLVQNLPWRDNCWYSMAKEFHGLSVCQLGDKITAFNEEAFRQIKVRPESRQRDFFGYDKVGTHDEKCHQLRNLLNFTVSADDDRSWRAKWYFRRGWYHEKNVEHIKYLEQMNPHLSDFNQGSANILPHLMLQCPKDMREPKEISLKFEERGWRPLFTERE